MPGAALPGPYTHASLHTKWESKQPAWGGLPRPAPSSPNISAYIHMDGKASSLPGAACLGQPYHLSIYKHVYMDLGKQSTGLGRGLPRPAPPSLYTCEYTHIKWKRQAAGCIGQPYNNYIYVCIHPYNMGKQTVCLGRHAWGSLELFRCSCIDAKKLGT